MKKEIKVAFANSKIKKSFDELKKGKFHEEQLYKFIIRSLDDLKQNPFCGTKIPKKIWPKEYKSKYKIDNLWKYNLPDAWRLIYTLRSNELEIVSMVLEWFDHKSYNRKFNY